MKRAFGTWNVTVRFASCEHRERFIEAVRLLLNTDKVGASLKAIQ